MKQLLGGLILALACACGGGSGARTAAATEPAPPAPAAPGPCVAMAAHATTEIVAMEGNLPPDKRAIVERVLVERCEQDAWSDEIIACISRAKGEELETCGEMFSPAQETAIDRAIEDALQDDARADEEGRMGGKDRDDLEGGTGARRKAAEPAPGDGVTDDPCGGGAQK